MTKVEAPQGSYRIELPDSTEGVIIGNTDDIQVLPSDELIEWMVHHNIQCTLTYVWNHDELHFDLETYLEFTDVDDAIFFKLTWNTR